MQISLKERGGEEGGEGVLSALRRKREGGTFKKWVIIWLEEEEEGRSKGLPDN